MDTDRSRDLARLGRMEQELALLRRVEQAALTYWHKTSCESHRYSHDEWDAMTDALADVAFFRKEHGDAT